MISAPFVLLLGLCTASADPGEPLLDLTVQGYSGLGFDMEEGEWADVMGQFGGSLTGWLHPSVGLSLRLDYGSFGLIRGDQSTAFLFSELRLRPAESDLAFWLGVGTNYPQMSYCMVGYECPTAWRGFKGILSAGGVKELALGPVHLPVGLRVELGPTRFGLGLDLGAGLRLWRGGLRRH